MQENETNLTNTSQRNSAFEILRIISVFFIISLHFAGHGAFDFTDLGDSTLILINRTWISFMQQFGKAGVNLFVLISAYFLIDGRFKTKKALAILIEMLFFSIIIGVVFIVAGRLELSFELLKSIVFPFGSNTWWFMTTYLLLYLLAPFLNLGIKKMNKKMHLVMTIVLIVIWSFLPTFLKLEYGFSSLGWFIALYFVSSYIKLYDVNIKIKPIYGILISFGIFCLAFLIKCGCRFFLKDDNYLTNLIVDWFNFLYTNNIIQFIASLILFMSFKKIKMKSYKAINIIASTSLTVYLLHDHSEIRSFLWIDLFRNASYSSSNYLIPYSILAVFAVFAIGVVIGICYKYTIGLAVNKLLSALEKKCFYKLDNIFNNNLV